MSDLIDRQAAIDAIEHITSSMSVCVNTDECHGMKRMQRQAVIELANLPSAQQEPQWIPVKSRPMDEEERKEWSERFGYDLTDDEAVIYASQLPEDGQECIVCTKWGNVFIDTFENDPEYGCAFEEHGDMDGITAWMPLPNPYAERRTENADVNT